MSNRLVGSATFIVSLSAMFCFLGFSLLSLWKTLRKRRLTVRELLVYVAGAGVAMALPNCFCIQSESYADIVVMWCDSPWGHSELQQRPGEHRQDDFLNDQAVIVVSVEGCRVV